ncbi:MAG: DUF6498-containing protein [Candidatus Taylorbacteria bacterium]|nr:DUF6498-containing protein [Candidatus Taylorbacteria bacterium]
MNETNAFSQIILPLVGIMAGIAFAVFWLWMLLRVIHAILKGIINFFSLLRKAPEVIRPIFLFLKTYPSVISIVAVNLMPLIGVIWFGWSSFSILFTYWVQTGIIGYFSLLKIKKVAEFSPAELPIRVMAFAVRRSKKAKLVTEIIRDYRGVYLFGMVASIIPLIFFTGYASKGVFNFSVFSSSFYITALAVRDSFGIIVFGSLLFVLNHGYSYIVNFVGKKEFLHSNLAIQLSDPIERVGTIWAAVFLGITMLGFIPHLIAILIVLVIFKTMFDVYEHLKEHGRFFRWQYEGG